jgi:hypothetical protein
MAYGSITGRARTSARSPQAHAICDRCGFRYNHVNLSWQYEWSGAALVNLRLLVCQPCQDRPQEQLRAKIIPPDPLPVLNPRPMDFITAAQNNRTTSGQNTVDPVTGTPIFGGDTRITQDSKTRVPQQTGEPPGGLNQRPGTSPYVPGDPGVPPGNDSVPETGPLT